jgi:hypothetical protein
VLQIADLISAINPYGVTRDFLAVPPQTRVYFKIYIERGQDFLWQVIDQYHHLSRHVTI